MLVDILSLFPGYFTSPLQEGVLRIAQEKQLLTINLWNIRDFTYDRHRRVDDRPYGGGPGMVLKPEPLFAAIDHVEKKNSQVIYLSPQGTLLDAKMCQELSQEEHLIFLCGHYEGIDQRVIDEKVNKEISIGNYVLSNGCLAALVLLDAITRKISGVLGNPMSVVRDSLEDDVLKGPIYTRPKNFEGLQVPDILASGHHEQIASWQQKKALDKMKKYRPDLCL